MSNIAIRVKNLGKEYRLGTGGYNTLRESLTNVFTAPFRRHKETGRQRGRLWALKDVSFEVKQGEVIGIIGRNGAGKTTLLRILTRITDPTRGLAEIWGRVGSLLEIGSGFHPELTGRENIYMNGAILGMQKREIDKKFDEIVEFSGVEEFIDTPLKRYSSGMQVRLAFSVAAQMESEILLVDEVLAVGDVAFQKKCLNKMEDVSRQGRTILFVSHNMQAIRSLCPRSILLRDGNVILDGDTNETIAGYYRDLQIFKIDNTASFDKSNWRLPGAVRFTNISLQNELGEECTSFNMGCTIRIALTYRVFTTVGKTTLWVTFRSGTYGEAVTSLSYPLPVDQLYEGQTGSIIIEFPNAKLRPGDYPLYFQLSGSSRLMYDIFDAVNLPVPLMVYTDKDIEELEFNPNKNTGYFNIDYQILDFKVGGT